MNTLKKDPIGFTLLACVAACLLFGCESIRTRAGLSWTNGEETVTATLDGKRVVIHGGMNLDGGEVGADTSFSLRKQKGLKK